MRAYTPFHPWLFIGICILLAGLTGYARAVPRLAFDPFRIEGKPPTLGYLTAADRPVAKDLLEVPMIADLATVLGTIPPRSMISLRRALSNRIISEAQCNSDSYLATLHLGRHDQGVSFGVFAIDDSIVALQSNEDLSQIVGISIAAFDRLGIRLPTGSTNQQAQDHNQLRFTLDEPYIKSHIQLDRRTIKARFKHSYPQLTRDLADESFQVRFPKNLNTSFPAGVLVWISPTPDGRIPLEFEPVLDSLGFIAIGVDDNGNQRSLTDRLQNHFDSIATLASRYRIDPNRVYLAGMSGGGRCSGILQLAFPDFFAGAVPIVGLDTYHNAPTGQPGMHWPARLGRPAGRWMRLLKSRRIAGITGTNDFNEPEMTVRQELLERDGIKMRLQVVQGMAHTMPTADQFAEALKWVDLPQRDSMIEEFKEAKKLMAKYTMTFGDHPPESPAARAQLIKIITLAPWTDPAIKACAMLGYTD